MGDYVIYVDESGDHGLEKINSEYPVFVLSACIFKKDIYAAEVVPSFLKLKFKYWNHDMVILHSRDIRKAQGDFRILQNNSIRTAFMGDLDHCINDADFKVVSAIINKPALTRQYAYPDNPYDIALTFCLERSFSFLVDLGVSNRETTVIVERRGANEDRDLELCFLRVVGGANIMSATMPFTVRFADKKVNSTGLQIADLVSYPIGRNYLYPTQPNRAYSIVSTKFRTSRSGSYSGYGRKVFP